MKNFFIEWTTKELYVLEIFQSSKRSRQHFDEILFRPDAHAYEENNPQTQQVLQKLRQIYHQKIKPVEKKFHYADLRRHVMSGKWQ